MRDVHRPAVAERLKKMRAERGLSVSDVAEAIQCHRTHLHHVEAAKSLGVAMLLDIARYYGVSAEEIVHGPAAVSRRRRAA